MNWKTKARIQNIVAMFPSEFSYEMYYQIQRHFGGYRKVNPFNQYSRLIPGYAYCKRILALGGEIKGKTFFEVGTGRNIQMPMAFWLMGAESVFTVDLNPYLKWDLIKEGLVAMAADENRLRQMFEGQADEQRLGSLMELARSSSSRLPDLMALCNFKYLAPGDASDTKLPDNSIDYHTSFTVYEHIPRNVLAAIMKEGNRIIKPGGLFLDHTDYSDHFEQMDKTITRINFLQFSDSVWAKYADNRYMYMNRLRHDDYMQLYKEANREIIVEEKFYNEKVTALIDSKGMPIDARFASKPDDILKVVEGFVISKFHK